MSVNWSQYVNTKVLRQSQWEDVVGTIADETRAGTRKVRAGNTFAPKTYSVQMRFNLDEYNIFKTWFELTTRKGAIPFYFPDLETSHAKYKFDVNDNNELYRFVPSSSLSYQNSGGNLIDVSMEWEKV